MDALKEVKLAVHKNINMPGLVADLIKQIADPALRDAVAKTDTKLDDLAVAALAPILESEINSRLKAAWEQLLSEGSGSAQGGDPV